MSSAGCRSPDGLTALAPAATPRCVLISVDLEDIRQQARDGDTVESRVVHNTRRILDFCDEHALRITFFVVGQMARELPDLIREVASRGHEIACHSDQHRGLDALDAASFRDDTERALAALADAGADTVVGYRAPVFSLTPANRWAWDVLADLGFQYSSSVLPAANPQYGWAGFPTTVQRHDAGIWEIPISTTGWPVGDIPFAGGTYLRILPAFLVRRLARRRIADGPVVSYMHPYDVDHEDTRLTVLDNPVMNRLLYYNRRSMLPKLAQLVRIGEGTTYSDYAARL